MTDTIHRTYCGTLAAGMVPLPSRQVQFRRGELVEFTVDEAALLDPADWGGTDDAPTGHLPDLADCTVAEVLAIVGDNPARAAKALEAEQAGRNRKTLTESLTSIVTAAEATTQEV